MFGKRVARLAGVGVAVLAASVLVAPVASASVLPGGQCGDTGVLNVVVTEAPAADQVLFPPTGVEHNVPNPPVPGAVVTIQRVGDFDLRTQAGWEGVANLAGSGTPGPLHPVAGGTVTVGADGRAEFTGLPLGAYWVTVTAPAGGDFVAPAPFLVTVPMRNPAHPATAGAPAWLCTVWAYPKAGRDAGLDKVVTTPATAIGDNITWTITADVPALTDGRIEDFRILDNLDPRLSFVSATAVLRGPGAAGTDTPLPAADLALTGTTPAAGANLIWTATTTGLDLLNDAVSGSTVVITLVTRVDSIGDGAQIANRAVLFVNDPTSGWEDCVFDPDADNYCDGPGTSTPYVPGVTWTSVRVEKWELVPGDAANLPLAGAVFQAFRTAADAATQTNPIALDPVGGEPAQTRFTTNAAGYVVIPGLNVGQNVWLVEVEAPAGFNLQAEVLGAYEVLANGARTITVTNVRSNAGFQLPMTGGTGAAIFGLTSLAILTTATLLATTGRRNKANNA